MYKEQITKLRDVEERHHSRLVEIAKTLSDYYHPRHVLGASPWDLIPEFSSALLNALGWYRNDRDSGYFCRHYYDPPKLSSGLDGLFESRYFNIVGSLRSLVMLLPAITPLYQADSIWFPTDENALLQSCIPRSSSPPHSKTESLAAYGNVLPGLTQELTTILKEFLSVCDEMWSGGWNS